MRNIITRVSTLVASLFTANILMAQVVAVPHTHQDTLRGTIGKERASWDVQRYDISVEPDYQAKTIKGVSMISLKWTGKEPVMQVDLQEPLLIDSVVSPTGNSYSFTREGNAWHVTVGADRPSNIRVYFHGAPRIAVRPPWDGGWIFTQDKQGRPWMSVACQGLGASVWYPCKDHQSDEPDQGASLSMTVPDTLVAVAMGRLAAKSPAADGKTTWRWEVKNPINNYNIIPYIGKYVNWSDSFAGEKGTLDCNYWVLDYELDKAKAQFTQAHDMLQCFEHWFGPYPFYEDGYKLVQSPHLGMEHQSAVGYGNKFQNGYLGTDLSGTGYGLKWDFIIVHESGHEWFGNNITSNDLADMWLHEGFTNYSETIFTTCRFGVDAGNAYVQGTRKRIMNKQTIIPDYGVNNEGSGDMYYKGGNLVHFVRQLVGDDEKFRLGLREMNKRWYHKTVNSSEVEAFWSSWSGKNLQPLFDQYLRHTEIPVLEYRVKGKKLECRWTNCISDFNIPVKVSINGKASQWIKPTHAWVSVKNKEASIQSVVVDPNFYVGVRSVEP